MKVVCFGDSNTYGYDPRSYFGDRYCRKHRWVDLLSIKSGWEIQNAGSNGREVPRVPITVADEVDLLIIMLGTNDLLQGRSVESIADAMERFLLALGISGDRVLLVAPPPMAYGEWVGERDLIDASHALAIAYEQLALKMNIRYVNAGEWNVPLCFDGVHFTEEGHIRFAEGLFAYLKKEKIYA